MIRNIKTLTNMLASIIPRLENIPVKPAPLISAIEKREEIHQTTAP